jgi:DNA-binding CsgD family transcriptional regulator
VPSSPELSLKDWDGLLTITQGMRAAMVDARRFELLLDQIYGAALDPTQWVGALQLLNDELSSQCATLYFQDRNSAHSNYVVGMERSAVATYDEHYYRLNPFPAAAARKPDGEISTGYESVDMKAMERGEFYNDFMRPQGLYDCMGFLVRRDADAVLALVTSRARGAGLYESADKRLMKRVSPHIQRAIEICRRLSVVQVLHGGLALGLDGLEVGAVLVDGDCRVLFVNRVAEAILRCEEGLTSRGGRLRAATPQATERLERQILATAATGLRRGDNPGGIVILPTPRGRPLMAVVYPCRMDMRLGYGEPAAIIFVSEPDGRVRINEQAVARIYDLTRSEARLLGALLEGKRLSEYAEEAGITLNTVKGYLKSVFSKTRTSRQSDLVRLVLSDQVLRLASTWRNG